MLVINSRYFSEKRFVPKVMDQASYCRFQFVILHSPYALHEASLRIRWFMGESLSYVSQAASGPDCLWVTELDTYAELFVGLGI